MPKLKNIVARNRIRTQETVVAPQEGNVGGALQTIADMVVENDLNKRKTRIEELKDTAKQQADVLKELDKLPPVEKRKQAQEFYEGKIANTNQVKGLVRETNKRIDLRRLDKEREDIYRWAIENGENEADAVTKIIRSEEELMEVLQNNGKYTPEETQEMVDELKRVGNEKQAFYQAVWGVAKNNYTKEELYGVVGLIKQNSELFDIYEMTEMTKVLVDAGVEAETIKSAEASAIMSAIGDNNLNKVLNDIKNSPLSDAEKMNQYAMVNQAIELRVPEFFRNLGYEPFAYGTASTQFSNFRAKFENEVTVNEQEARRLAHDKEVNFGEFWGAQGNRFDGDYRTTRNYTADYLEQTQSPEIYGAYLDDPEGTMANLYIENAIPGFSYMSEAQTQEFSQFMNDINTPQDLKYTVQKNQANVFIGKAGHNSIEFEIFHENAFKNGGYSPELVKGLDILEDRNLTNVAEKIQQGKFINEGALGRLDSFTLAEAMKTSNLAPTEILEKFDVFNKLSQEPGFGRISRRFYTEFGRLLSYHLKNTSTQDEGWLTMITGKTNPTDALLTGGYPTDIFNAIIQSEEFGEDLNTLLNAYTLDRTIMVDNKSGEPVVVDLPEVTQDTLDAVRALDFKSRPLYYREITENGYKWSRINEEQAGTMVIDVVGQNYQYQLEGGIAYEKDLATGDFVPYTSNIQSFVRAEQQEDPSLTTQLFRKVEDKVEAINRTLGNNQPATIYKQVPTKFNYLTGNSPLTGATLEDATNRTMPNEPMATVKLREFAGLNNVAEGKDIPRVVANRESEKTLNRIYGKLYREGKRVEGTHPTRYKSAEGGTDTIGIGHKMTQAEHDGGYVTINGEKVSTKKPLTEQQIEQLYYQDYTKAVDRLNNQFAKYDVDPASLSEEMSEVALRLTFNTGRVFDSVMKGIANNDLGQVNYGLLRGIGMTKDGNKYIVPGLAVDRAISYNTINESPIAYVEFEKADNGKVSYTYYDTSGRPVQTFKTTRQLAKGSKFNKKYYIDRR